MQIMLNEGDEVIIPSPYWVSYPDMVKLAGGTPVFIETDSDTGFKFSPEQLSSKITSRTRAVVINSPSNPTGAAYTRDELKAFAEVLEKDVFYIDVLSEILSMMDSGFAHCKYLRHNERENYCPQRYFKNLCHDRLANRLYCGL
jgi:aspartate aminotransferase